LNLNSSKWLGNYQIGLELIILNALITGIFLLTIRKKSIQI
jgi:hypothetical protein